MVRMHIVETVSLPAWLLHDCQYELKHPAETVASCHRPGKQETPPFQMMVTAINCHLACFLDVSKEFATS